MKGTHIAVFVLGAAVVAALFAYPAFAAASSSSSVVAPNNGMTWRNAPNIPPPGAMSRAPAAFGRDGGRGGSGWQGRGEGANFTTGQVITLTSTTGNYFVVGTQGKTNGTASGTLAFTVEGKLASGYVLSVAGSITVAGTTYSMTSGSAVMVGGATIQGEGATSSSGSYTLRATARGDFSGAATSNVSLDFSNGTTEYTVFLPSTIAG